VSSLWQRAFARPAVFERGAVSFNGQLLPLQQSWGSTEASSRLAHNFVTYVEEGYRSNGIVFAVILARLMLFSEATFAFQHVVDGRPRPGDLFGGPALAALEQPWTNATTGDLTARMEQDVSLAGNSYTARRPKGLKRMRPDWVEIVYGTESGGGSDALDAEVLAYLYTQGGRFSGNRAHILLPEEVAHYAPIPDPLAPVRGMSWLTPVAREIDADSAMTRHKAKFFDNAATPNMIIKTPRELKDLERKRIVATLRAKHEGTDNAYRTMLVESGADVVMVGNTFEQISFATTQAAGENRISVAGGVPGIVAGLKEGLQAATYSNYGQAMRRFADLTMRPLWRNAAGSLATVVDVPPNARLTVDLRDIAALKQDAKDAADIGRLRAETIANLVKAGYESTSVTTAVVNDDLTLLVHAEPALDLKGRIDAAGVLVRAGFDPAAALTAVGLDPIKHTGLVPITVTLPEAP
jgi:phage portal protein BeeE